MNFRELKLAIDGKCFTMGDTFWINDLKFQCVDKNLGYGDYAKSKESDEDES